MKYANDMKDAYDMYKNYMFISYCICILKLRIITSGHICYMFLTKL